MKIRTRALIALVIIGLGLIVGGQLTPSLSTSSNRPVGDPRPDIYFLVPTAASVSISTLNGSAYLIISQIAGNLSLTPPIVNVSVTQKDIVTFAVPARGYYAVEFLEADKASVGVTYTLSEGNDPSDLILYGSLIVIIGMSGVVSLGIWNWRHSKKRESHA